MRNSSTKAAPTLRPTRVRRLSRNELMLLDYGKYFNNRLSSSKSRFTRIRPFNTRQSSTGTSQIISSATTIQTQISNSSLKNLVPDGRHTLQSSSHLFNELGETTGKTLNRKKKRHHSRRCFWLTICFCVLILLLLAAVAGLIIALLLRNTTTITTTTTTATTTTATTSTSSTSTTSTSSTTSSTSTTTRTTSSTSSTTTKTTSTSTTSKTTTTTKTTTSTSVTTTTQTTTTTTRPWPTLVCTDYGRGSIYQQFTASPSVWTQVIRSYTANYTDPILLFGIQTSGGDSHYLDSISVVDTTNPTIELLDNAGFSNTTLAFAGWTQWCVSTCNNNGNTAVAEQQSMYPCTIANKCLQATCDSTVAGIYFIGQKFEAVLGRTYTISFDHIHMGSSSGNELYVDII